MLISLCEEILQKFNLSSSESRLGIITGWKAPKLSSSSSLQFGPGNTKIKLIFRTLEYYLRMEEVNTLFPLCVYYIH